MNQFFYCLVESLIGMGLWVLVLGIIARPNVHRRNRFTIRPEEHPVPAQIHWTAAVDSGTGNVKFTVDQPFVVRGTPFGIFITQGGPKIPCTAVTLVSLNTFELAFGVTVSSGNILTVPDFVDEIRSESAGWLDPGVVTLSTPG